MSTNSPYTEIGLEAPRCNNYNKFSVIITIMTAALGPVALIIMGVINLLNCQNSKNIPYIPICLIGLGITSIFRLFLYLITRLCHWNLDERMSSCYSPLDNNLCGQVTGYLLNVAVVTWICVGAACTFDHCRNFKCENQFDTFCFCLYIYLIAVLAIGFIYLIGNLIYKLL